MKKLEILRIEWNKQPRVRQRAMTKEIADDKELRKDIEKKPYRIVRTTELIVTFRYDGQEYTKRETIEAGWTYNYADIPWIVEPITCDKHSPYMKIPSLAHDRVLDRRYALWYEWDLVNIFNNDLGTFRKLTSLIFEYLCIDAGIREHKAHIMAEAVDMFQRFLPSWNRRSFNKYKEEMGF